MHNDLCPRCRGVDDGVAGLVDWIAGFCPLDSVIAFDAYHARTSIAAHVDVIRVQKADLPSRVEQYHLAHWMGLLRSEARSEFWRQVPSFESDRDSMWCWLGEHARRSSRTWARLDDARRNDDGTPGALDRAWSLVERIPKSHRARVPTGDLLTTATVWASVVGDPTTNHAVAALRAAANGNHVQQLVVSAWGILRRAGLGVPPWAP
jgi:hypothetical protein